MGTSKSLRLGLIFCFVAVIATQRLTNDEGSDEDEVVSGGYILPKQIFNEGKPFYVDKDPISGQLDFSSKKPAGIEPEVNEVVDPKEKIVLNHSAPNIHDFLNLPVKYSSSKFVYPLVSSSYANLKYQGNNKNYVSNHKNHTSIVSPPPKYFTPTRANITRLHPATFPHSTTDQPIKYDVTTPVAVTKNKYAPTKKYATTTTTIRNNFLFTTRPTIVPRPVATTTTTSTTVRPTTSTSTTTTTQRTTTTTIPTTTITYLPSTTQQIVSTNIPTTTTTMYPITTTDVPPYRPLPPLTTLPNFDAAEVYNSVGQKKDPSSMLLEDIFNVFSEDSVESLPNKTDTTAYNDYQSQEIPLAQPAPFSIYTTQRQPVDIPYPTELIPQVNPVKDSNNYVHYQVQQPSSNVVNYHVPSMNNIMISADQNSTSFVIGSQQSVGSSIVVGTGDKPPTMFGNGQQIHYGTVINEQLTPAHVQQGHTNAQQGPPRPHIYPGQPPIPQQTLFSPLGHPSMQQTPGIQTMQQHHDQSYHALPLAKPTLEAPQTQELLVQSNIRFPSENVVNGHGSPTNFDEVNSISGGMSSNLGVVLPANPVVFPKHEYPEKGSFNHAMETGNPIIFQQEEGATDRGEILTLNQQKMVEKKYPRLPENLTPPNPSVSHKWPNAPIRHHTSTPSNKFNEFTRKPLPGLRRPNPDRPLPNILPQFRPNAKISHGHPNFNREPGNIRVPHNNAPFPNRLKAQVPPFAHRRTPIANRYNFKGGPLEAVDNRRVYKVPPPFPHNVNRMYLQRQQRPPPGILFAPQRPNEGFIGERHASQNTEQFFSPEQTRPERLPAFEEEDFMISDPPKPVVKKDADMPSLEPVVTLQMLKNKKRIPSPALKKLYPEVSEHQPTVPPTLQGSASGQSPVYVVYPMKAETVQYDGLSFGNEAGEPVVVGQRGDQSPIPPADVNKSPQTFDYENTPFSVVRDQPQEPILMVKNKSQTYDNGDFPYPLEKPDPVFAEFSKQQELQRFDQNSSVHLLPRVVNRGNTAQVANGNSPIAIAYTPTETTNYYENHKADTQFSRPNLASQVIPEIQTEASLNEELDTRGQYFEKDFMAPFYPSVSLSDASNSQQGWSVFTSPSSTENSIHDKNNINRVDINGDGPLAPTEKFDLNRFNPELQGGFKPIYPSDYKQRRDDDSESDEEISLDIVSTTSSTTTTAAPITTTSISMSSLSPPSESTTVAPTEATTKRVKSVFETSLESLLFGDDENYDEEDLDRVSNVSSSS